VRLRFSRRADYAIRAALELARDGGQRTSEHIARATGAPGGVVAQALSDLARVGIVQAVVGRTGGYLLARPASEISVLEVVEAVDPIGRVVTQCVLHERVCSHEGACPFHATMVAAQEAFRAALERETLADVALRASPSGSSAAR
jgi:Rrf2 family protein